MGSIDYRRSIRGAASMCLTGMLLPLPLPALSQIVPSDDGATKPVNLKRVEVTGSTSKGDGSTPESGGLQVSKQSFGPFGNVSPLDIPFSTNALSQALIRDTQARDISELGRNDPSFGNYALPSASGYANFFIRGFQVDESTNNRIDGLPVSSQSGLVFDSVERVDIFKGLFGLLYGFGNPGGMINYVSKQPLGEPLTELKARYYSDSQFGVAADISRRLGPAGQFGVRLNVAGVSGETSIDGQHEHNSTAALALDWRPDDSTRVWTNLSYTHNAYHRVQPGVFLGSFDVPKAPDASKSLGVDFGGHTGNTRGVEGGFELQATSWLSARGTIGNFRALRNVRYDGAFVTDNNGDYTFSIFPHNLWDISDTSGEFAAIARFESGSVKSATSVALTLNRETTHEATVQEYMDLGGTSNLYAPIAFADPNEPFGYSDPYNAKENYRNVVVAETLDVDRYLTLTAGVAVSRISLTADDGEAFDQTKTTPSLGIVFKPTVQVSLYGSYIRGLQAGQQADQTLGAAPVTNALQYLPPFVSTQYEIGGKAQITEGLIATVALFRIDRPLAIYLPTTPAATAYTFTNDGQQVNTGVEFNVAGRLTSDLKVFGGITGIRARIGRSQDGLLDGNRPIGIPSVQATLVAEYDVAPLPGLGLVGAARYKGRTEADATNVRSVPGIATFDAGLKYETALSGRAVTGRFYVSNIADRSAWSGSVFGPFLYLGDPRTARVEVSARF